MVDRPLHIACVGEAMVELPRPGQSSAHFAVSGDTLNAAIYLRRALPQAHRVSFVTALGRDPLSDQMLTFMAAEGIETADISRHPDLLPGLYMIMNCADGERHFLYWRDNSAAKVMFGAQAFDFSALQRFDVIYASAITFAILSPQARDAFLAFIAKFREAGGLFAFDSNYRAILWDSADTAREIIDRAWHLTDIALPSEDDERAVFGEADEAGLSARFATYGHAVSVLKRAGCGPRQLGTTQASPHFEKAKRVVDATAAGDSFSGTFLAGYLQHESVAEAMAAAHKVARHVVGHTGAIISGKDYEQVKPDFAAMSLERKTGDE
jgi:2-dehydro-3-deoxygluconokinase